MDHHHHFNPSKSSNLQIILLFSLLIFSQFLHISLSQPDLDEFVDVHPTDKKVLVQIQKQLGKNNTQVWTSMTRCCVIFCSFFQPMTCNFDGHVVKLNLTFTSPTRVVIPTALGDLVYLDHLVLSGPYITEPALQPVYKLTKLLTLHIDNTNITGPIPGIIFKMTNLFTLRITNNRFVTGSIPRALVKLTKLFELDLRSNWLSSLIPDFLGQMSQLRWVNLKANRLSGPIPTSLGRLVDLTLLDLSNNRLTGSIPYSFGSFNNSLNPIALLLNNNRLTGSIPRAMAQAQLSSIDVSSNKLTGSSSLRLFQKTNSQFFTINLSNNHFKFNFSKANFSKYLAGLNISHNMIYNTIPKALGELQLLFLDVSYNQLCGPIPSSPVLSQLSPTNFAHNKCLCGAPLGPCK